MKKINGYKVTDYEMKCRGYQYELNKEFSATGEIIICKNGFHFCKKADDCFNYYEFNKNNRVFEVEAKGVIVEEGDKSCAEKIMLLRELTWHEVLEAVNIGKDNTGRSNSGNWNSGNWNSGNRNSGDSNSGYRNSGAFCTDLNPTIWLFNKPSRILVRDWENSRAYRIMNEFLQPNIWIYENAMSDEEKESNPSYKTTGGYLKSISLKEAWQNMWPNLSDENKKEFTSLPNFDAKIFKEITGIK